jgi:tight adherence protein C
MDKIYTIIAAIAFTLAVVGVLYAFYQLFKETPLEDRTYKDKPPAIYRLLWPLILLLSVSLKWALSPKQEAKIQSALVRGGQDYTLNPIQFFVGQILSAGIAFIFGLILTSMLGKGGLSVAIILGLLGYFYPNLWLKEVTTKRNTQILKALPFFVDLLTLSIEAGLNLSGSLQAAVDRSRPGPLVVEIDRALRDIRGGKARMDALRDFSDRLQFIPITSFVSALIQGEKTGSSLSPILRAQSDQRRIERFLRAEKLAMEAPVKMLGPLILCIFPCTFIVIGFPIAMKFLASGIMN